MKLRLNDLRNFVDTAQKETMAAASRHLGITQPALSESIKRLETDLSQVLFYRSKSGIQLTPSGKILFGKSRVLLSQLAEIESENPKNTLALGRMITVGCHPVVASYTLPKSLAAFSQVAPDFRTQIFHGSSRFVQNEIQAGRIDVGIVVNPTKVPDLVIREIGEDEVFVWSNGQSQNKLICHNDIFQTSYILRKWKSAPTEIIESESLELIARLTAEGIGYGILPERTLRLLGLKLKKHTELPSYKDSICLIHRPEFGRSEFERAFINSIKTTFK